MHEVCEKADTRIRTADLLFTKHTFAALTLLTLLYPFQEQLFRSEGCCSQLTARFSPCLTFMGSIRLSNGILRAGITCTSSVQLPLGISAIQSFLAAEIPTFEASVQRLFLITNGLFTILLSPFLFLYWVSFVIFGFACSLFGCRQTLFPPIAPG